MALRIRFQYPTGSNLGYSIERLVDGTLYDFSTSTFVATPTTLIAPIPEDTGSFLGRYKVTLDPTPVAQFADGHYCVTVHDQKTNSAVVAELAATMTNGDDTPAVDTLMGSLQQLLSLTQQVLDEGKTPKALTLTNIYPSH